MRITLNEEQKAHCIAIGVSNPPEEIDVPDHEWHHAVSLWKRVGSDIDHELKAVGHLAWQKCRNVGTEVSTVAQQAETLVESKPLISLKNVERLLALIAFLLVLLVSETAHCQWSQIKTITFQNSDNTVAGLAAGPFTIRPSSGTWSRSGTTWTLTVTAASGSVAWDAITNPLGGGLTLTQFANGNTFLTVKRKTDTTPTGAFFDFQNALGSSLCKLDITGTFVGCSFPYANLTGVPALPANTTATGSNFFTAYNSTTGAFTKSQPACGDLSNAGTLCTSSGPLAVTKANVLHQWFNSYTSGTGAFTATQPACGDLSDAGAFCNGTAYGSLTGTPTLPATKTAAAGQPLLSYDSATGLFTQGALTAANVGLGSVTNDAQTKAAIVPNTAPSATQLLIGNAGGTAYAPVTLSGPVSVTSAGVTSVATLNQNTSGSAATLTTPRSIYGNNFDGSAALAQIIASTFGGTGNGFTKFSGPLTAEKTFTLPNASAVVLTDNAAVTVAQGGTGLGTLTSHALYAGNGTTAPSAISVPAADSMLYGTTGADPLFKALPTSGTNGCAGATDMLQWNTTTHAWACGTAGAGGGVSSISGGTGPISNSASTGAVTLTYSGTSGGIPYFSSATALSSSAALTVNVLPKGGGAGGAPTNSSITDNGTTVATAEPIVLGTANCTTFGTAGGLCATEGTALTNVAGASVLYPDSTAHEWKAAMNGSSTAGIMNRTAGAISLTAQTATIATTTACAASAGACNVAGQYELNYNFWGTGTACSSVTAGKVVLTFTWTDENGTTHTAIPAPIAFDQKAAAGNVTGTFSFNTALGTEGAYGSFPISTNGTVIQYAATYTACTTGTGAFGLRISTTRMQ